MKHQLTTTDAGFCCLLCGATWKREPYSDCPGVTVYAWGAWPPHLLTKKQMGEAGYQTGRRLPPPAGAVYREKSPDGIMRLYDRAQGVPKKPLSDEQRAALKAASEKSQAGWVCVRCGRDHEVTTRRGWTRRVYLWPPTLCWRCTDHDKILNWARDLLAREDGFVILDTETTGLYDAEIIQIAVVDSRSEVLLDTLVKPLHPERMLEAGESSISAYDIHGIHPDRLIGAPTFPQIYPGIARALANRLVVIYNAEFDTGLLYGDCRRHDLPILTINWNCAMIAYSQLVGEWSSWWGNYRYQRLPGGSHNALDDCRAVLALIREIAESEGEV